MVSRTEVDPPETALWLIDGFNLLHACLLRGRDRAQWWNIERQRELMSWLAPFACHHPVRVVFDAASETSPRLDLEGTAVALGYAPSADDAIVEHVRAHPQPAVVCVVTADRSLADRCRRWGARIERPWDFARRIGSP